MAEGRRVAARPKASPVGHHHQHSPLGPQHPPELAQGRADGLAHLQMMDHEKPVHAGILERERILAHEHRAIGPRVTGLTVIGTGYAVPYLSVFAGEAARLGAMMPANTLK